MLRDYEDFRRLVIMLRDRSGRSQEAVAKKLGFGQSRLGNWEAGSARPSLDNAIALLHELGVGLAPVDLHDAQRGELALAAQRLEGEDLTLLLVAVRALGSGDEIDRAFVLGLLDRAARAVKPNGTEAKQA